MKKIIILLLLTLTSASFAQLTNKGDVKIKSGTTMYVSFDMINDNGTSHTWSNDGTVIIKGDSFTNNGTMDDTATGTTEFSGANEQSINGTSTSYFHNLKIDNNNNSVLQHSVVDTDNMEVSDGAKDFDYKVDTELPLYVRDALTLNGDIRLIGTSQLVQTHTGVSQVGGGSFVWLDQQGTTNQYRYNYWSSPVNQSGSWVLSNFRDGAQGDDEDKSTYPVSNFVSSTAATDDITNTSHPVTLNSYWIWTLPNGAQDDYNAWVHVGDAGSLSPGQGYTMKGPGVDKDLHDGNGSNTTEYDSWTFAGQPNDGDYGLTIDPGKDYLVGNPYPSALDADEFINDNISSGNNSHDIFNGTLYFWEHAGGDTHIYTDYVGGYATYTLTGGTAATDWQGTGTTVGTKTPQRYIPVGQGFGVWAESGNDGGTIVFENDQRVFKTEGSSSVFVKSTGMTDIRLGFTTPQNYHRELLLGIRANTTEGVDVGWDGPRHDEGAPDADATWNIDSGNFIIQAVPVLNNNSRFPLNVNVAEDGLVNFTIDSVNNLPMDVENIYIEDSFNNTYNQINDGKYFEIYLNAGEYNDRFALVFNDPTVGMEQLQLDDVYAYYDQSVSELIVSNAKNKTITAVRLFALTGQEVLSYNKITTQSEIRLPAQLTTGLYLVNVKSEDNKIYTAKLIVK